MLNQAVLARNRRGEKMESTLKNMVLSLLGVTFIASLSVGIVNMITEEPIREAQERATQEALQKVVPPFRKNSKKSVEVDGVQIDVYTTKSARNELIGYAVKSYVKEGYSGAITMMVGMLADGRLNDVSVLSHSETPGLGSKMCDEGNILISSVKGKNLSELDFKVKKDGGDIDALSGATITSRAYGVALSRAIRAVQMVEGDDSDSSAVDADAIALAKQEEEARLQKLRMEQMMKQAKQNQAKGEAAASKDSATIYKSNADGYYVDSVMMRQILRQYSYERYDWFLKKVEQEYRSDKEIKRRSAQLAAVAAQRAKQREAEKK